MRINRHVTVLIAGAALIAPSVASAQGGGRGGGVTQIGTFHVSASADGRVIEGAMTEILNVEPMENVPAIAGAPFTGDATTEFTQLLPDGNRIDRRFTTSLARDGKGRTRSEQDIAMLGPLVVLQKGMNWTAGSPASGGHNDALRYTVIADPVEGVTFTLDERAKEARRSPFNTLIAQAIEIRKVSGKLDAARSDEPVVESLGTRQIEGVRAEGTRSTMTIPAGQIGNLNPINVVTERWFSRELQMAVLITRRDPQSGETVYRLTNIVRNEPPPDLFIVPSDYRIVDLGKKIDEAKRQLEERRKKAERAKAAAGQE